MLFEDFLFLIYGILTPITSVFGYIGNILTMIVLWRKDMASLANFFLRALVLSDICIITCVAVGKTLPVFYARFLSVDLSCSARLAVPGKYVGYFMMTVQMCNEYVLVLISVERYIAVCHPLKLTAFRTRRKVLVSLCVVVVFSFLYNIPHLFALKAIISKYHDSNFTLDCYQIVFTEFGESMFFRRIYSIWMYLGIYFVFPLGVILVLNISVIKELVRIRIRRQHLGLDLNTQQENITRVIIIIIAVFFITQVLGFFAQLLEVFGTLTDRLYFIQIVNYVYVLNSSINFIIYVACGRKFREKFSASFKRCVCRLPSLDFRNANVHGVSDTPI